MTLKRNILPVSLMCAALTSCEMAQEVSPVDNGAGVATVTLSIWQGQTKTSLGEPDGDKVPVYWTSGDRIAVNGVASFPLDVASGEMLSRADFKVNNVQPPYSVIYPAEAWRGRQQDGRSLISIPAVQEYQPDSFGSGADILYGVSGEDEIVAMNHLCGTIRVGFTDSEAGVIRHLTLTSLGDSPVTGDFALDMTDGTLEAAGNNENAVTLSLPETGVSLGAETKNFYFTIPAGSYPGGFELKFEDADARILRCYWLRSAEGAEPGVTVTAGKLISFSSQEYKPGAREIRSAEEWEEFVADYNAKAEGWEEEWLGTDGVIRIGADFTAKKLSRITSLAHTIDGGGHTLTQTEATLPLVTNLTGALKNLTLAGNMVPADHSTAGAVVFATNLKGGEIENCHNETDINLSSAGKSVVAGFVRTFNGGSIIDCTNKGNVTVIVNLSNNPDAVVASGFVAMARDFKEPALIRGCTNDGKVSVTVESTSTTVSPVNAGYAGFVGNVNSGDATNFLTISGCVNNADISVTYKNDPTAAMNLFSGIGGILGLSLVLDTSGRIVRPDSNGGAECNIVIEDCANYGNIFNGLVSSTSSEAINDCYAGGIAGAIFGLSAHRAKMSNCRTYGKVIPYEGTKFGRTAFSSIAGGLLGFGANIDIDDCIVKSSQVGTLKKQSYAVSAAVGLMYRSFSMKGCKFFADLQMIRSKDYSENSYSLGFTLPTTNKSGNTAGYNLGGSSITDCAFGGSFTINTTLVDYTASSGFSTTEKTVLTVSTFADYIASKSYGAGQVTMEGNTYWNGQTE